MLSGRILTILCLVSGVVLGDQGAYFETHVRPLLVAHCYECHSAEEGSKIKGGLRLDHREGFVIADFVCLVFGIACDGQPEAC
jgi:hypothetical protein